MLGHANAGLAQRATITAALASAENVRIRRALSDTDRTPFWRTMGLVSMRRKTTRHILPIENLRKTTTSKSVVLRARTPPYSQGRYAPRGRVGHEVHRRVQVGRLADDQTLRAYRHLQSHFDVLNLADRYRRMGLEHLGGQYYALRRAYGPNADAQRVAQKLIEEAEDFEAASGPNYWLAKLYRAVATNEAFCGGGFEIVRVQAQA
jgi:hypothetical protein